MSIWRESERQHRRWSTVFTVFGWVDVVFVAVNLWFALQGGPAWGFSLAAALLIAVLAASMFRDARKQKAAAEDYRHVAELVERYEQRLRDGDVPE